MPTKMSHSFDAGVPSGRPERDLSQARFTLTRLQSEGTRFVPELPSFGMAQRSSRVEEEGRGRYGQALEEELHGRRMGLENDRENRNASVWPSHNHRALTLRSPCSLRAELQHSLASSNEIICKHEASRATLDADKTSTIDRYQGGDDHGCRRQTHFSPPCTFLLHLLQYGGTAGCSARSCPCRRVGVEWHGIPLSL
ncbi:hypothetical protein FB45DRAFT_914747, partial [Roridomyces roridus]